jgi:hypothetical protein
MAAQPVATRVVLCSIELVEIRFNSILQLTSSLPSGLSPDFPSKIVYPCVIHAIPISTSVN